eukprot:3918350-Alexandrium_andersonii.AAC.1
MDSASVAASQGLFRCLVDYLGARLAPALPFGIPPDKQSVLPALAGPSGKRRKPIDPGTKLFLATENHNISVGS